MVYLEPVRFDAGATRSFPDGRPCVYDPQTNTLSVTRGKKTTDYEVSEFEPDRTEENPVDRAFRLVKAGSDEVYYVLIGAPGRHSCDCAGFSYEGAQKANRLAFEKGQPVFFTGGCVHVDCCLRLVWEQLL